MHASVGRARATRVTLTSSSLWLLLCRALPHHARTLARIEHKLTFKLSSVDHEVGFVTMFFRPSEGDRPFVPPLATITTESVRER
jgi:hypothetical protein